MPATTPTTPDQLTATHTPLINRILDRGIPTNTTPTEFIALLEEASDITNQLNNSYMEAATEDLAAAAVNLTDALNAGDTPDAQAHLAAAHHRLHGLDINEFVW
jgi:hypothetical protein